MEGRYLEPRAILNETSGERKFPRTGADAGPPSPLESSGACRHRMPRLAQDLRRKG